MLFQDQLTALDGQIATARTAAAQLASRAKGLRQTLRDRLASVSGNDKQARDLHVELSSVAADQAFEEERVAALNEHRAAIAAEAEASRAKAERRAKIEAFKTLVAKRDAAATVAETAINQLGNAAREIIALNTEIKLALPTVNLPRNAIDDEMVHAGILGSLYLAGMRFLLRDTPVPRYDSQGKPLTTIEARVAKAGADMLAMLPKEG